MEKIFENISNNIISVLQNYVNEMCNFIRNYEIITTTNVFIILLVVIITCILFLILRMHKTGNSMLKQEELQCQISVMKTIHEAAMNSNDPHYERKCITLIKRYPEAINYQLPHLYFTPFLRACYAGNYYLVKVMLEMGADIQLKTIEGDSAIFLCSYHFTKNTESWNPKILNILFRYGCDVNIPKQHGYTALHLAAKSGHEKLACWLLAHGADPDLPTTKGLKPIECARIKGHYNIVKLLTVSIGNVNYSKNLCDEDCDCDCHTK